MNWISLGAGSLLVVAGIVDLVWTSLWVNRGAGPVSRAVGSLSWRSIYTLAGKDNGLLTAAGPLIITLTVIAWVVLLWCGWFLIFTSEVSAVVSSSTNQPAEAVERLYFAGYTIFTLGNGEFQPAGGRWQVATALAAGSGLFAFTLAFSYLISVVSAAVSARTFAAQVSGLGSTPADAVAAAWDGSTYSALAFPLQSLAGEATKLGQQLLAYPVLQYFHAGKSNTSPILALARLEQILAIVRFGVPEAARPAAILLNSAQSAVGQAVETLARQFSTETSEPLPDPILQSLREANLPVLPVAELSAALRPHQERRRKFQGLLEAHGWSSEDLRY